MFVPGIVLALSPTANASATPESQSQNKPCNEISYSITWRSNHLLGRRTLNEDNQGILGICWLDPKQRYYWNLGGIHNSQYGDTFAAGIGVRFYTPTWYKFTGYGGAELQWLHYESARRGNAYVYGFLPTAVLGILYTFHDSLKVGPEVRYFSLGRERVLLWGASFTLSF